MNNLRLPRKNEVLPEIEKNESYNNFIKRNNGGDVFVYGNIGRGDKTHKLRATYIPINNENVIVSYTSICGAESYKSISFINMDATSCNCKRCDKSKSIIYNF